LACVWFGSPPNHTLRIWERHGIRQAGFWTTLVGESNQRLTYMLAWDSLAEREKRWSAFLADPEWIATAAETEKDGQLVQDISNQLLMPKQRATHRARRRILIDAHDRNVQGHHL
jgi:hypothetical protein